MQTLTHGLAHLLGAPDISLLKPYYQYSSEHASYFSQSEKADRPFQSLLGYTDEDYDYAKKNNLLALEQSGYSPEGRPVYALPYFHMLSKNDVDEISSLLRSTPSDHRQVLKEYLLEDSRFKQFNARGSYVSRRSNHLLHFDEDFNPYNLEIHFRHMIFDQLLQTECVYRKLRSYFSIEQMDGVFYFNQNAVMCAIIDGKLHVEPLRMATVSIPDLLEWQNDHSLRVFRYINTKGKVSKTSHFDTFFRLHGTTRNIQYVDANENPMLFSSRTNDFLPYIIDKSFFSTELARYSGLAEHPLLRTYTGFDDASYEEQRIIHDVLSSLSAPLDTNHHHTHIDRFISEFDLYLEDTELSRRAAAHSSIFPLSERFHIIKEALGNLYTEDDWRRVEDTPLSYLDPENEMFAGGHIPMTAFSMDDYTKLFAYLKEKRESFVISDQTLTYSPTGYLLKNVVPSADASLFSFTVQEDAVQRILQLHMKSTKSYQRAFSLSALISYLFFWRKNPAIEQVIKDKNNLHLSRIYYQEFVSLANKDETSSIRALGIEGDVRSFLQPLEHLISLSPHYLRFDKFYKTLNTELALMKRNGFSFTQDLKDIFRELCPSTFDTENIKSSPQTVDTYVYERELRKFSTLLQTARAIIPVNPVTLYNYARRIDMVQAIPYDDALFVWRDYVNMKRIVMEDEPFDLFPSRSLRMAHDIAQRQSNAVKQKVDTDRFNETMERWRKLGLERSSQNYVISLPKQPQDIVKEGVALNHCVGSYVNRAANGNTIILFLRKKSSPDTPFITLEINPTQNTLVQAEGRNRRGYTQAGQEGVILVRTLLQDIEGAPPLAGQ